MDLVTAIITLLVGSAIFITGMNMMSGGLKKAAGKGLKKIFKNTQNNTFANMGMGAGVTALIQSSAATCVMAIGFINAGVMTVYQGVTIMMGAYVGTTVTGLLVSLSSFNVSVYFTLLAFIGVVLMFFKNYKIKNIGEICCGFGLLFFGLSTMSQTFKNSPEINGFMQDMFANINNPLLLLLIGILFTALVQSSSATTGIVIVMVGSGAAPFSSALYIALGATIGTCITTLISTIGTGVNAKRAGLVSLFIKLITGFTALAIVWPLENIFVNFFSSSFGSAELGVAIFVLLYNVIFMLLILPLVKPLIRLSERLIKDKNEEKKQKYLKYIDNRLLSTPELALMQVKNEIFINMFGEAKINLERGFNYLVKAKKDETTKLIPESEDKVDYINKRVSEYLIALSDKVNASEAKKVGTYFHVINDIERIGDHAYNFYENAARLEDDELVFSEAAQEELREFYKIIVEMEDLVERITMNHEINRLSSLHELEDTTDNLSRKFADNHYKRMSENKCNAEASGIFSTTLSEMERVADHLTNIGYCTVNPTGDEDY